MPLNWEQLQNVCRMPREYLDPRAQLTWAAGRNKREHLAQQRAFPLHPRMYRTHIYQLPEELQAQISKYSNYLRSLSDSI